MLCYVMLCYVMLCYVKRTLIDTADMKVLNWVFCLINICPQVSEKLVYPLTTKCSLQVCFTKLCLFFFKFFLMIELLTELT